MITICMARKDSNYMSSLKESIIVAFAFVGVVVGAGFATGQEIFQFLLAMVNLVF